MNDKRIDIIVTLQFEAFHSWPQAPEQCKFLRSFHRHVLHIKCWKEVSGGDREIEIIGFKTSIVKYLESRFPAHDFGTLSCEQIALLILETFNLSRCEVLEDNENGATISVTGKLKQAELGRA